MQLLSYVASYVMTGIVGPAKVDGNELFCVEQ
jgi:hypothetical protein